MRWFLLLGLAACATAPARAPRAPADHAVFVPRLIDRKVNTMTPAELEMIVRPVSARPAGGGLLDNLSDFPGTPNAPAVEVAYCIDENGRVISTMPEVPEARSWQFAPYFVGDKAVVACSYTTI